MALIKDVIEKHEYKIENINSIYVKNAIRGFIFGMDIIPSSLEAIIQNNCDNISKRHYTVGCKSMSHIDMTKHDDITNKLYFSLAAGLGSVISYNLYCAPWVISGCVDLINLCMKKRIKK